MESDELLMEVKDEKKGSQNVSIILYFRTDQLFITIAMMFYNQGIPQVIYLMFYNLDIIWPNYSTVEPH